MINETNIPEYIVKPNPEAEIYKEVTEAVRANGNYCCCAITKEPDTMCMCKEFRDQEESGFCHCNRFFKVKNRATIAIVCHPGDYEYSIGLAEGLNMQGFNVALPFYRDAIQYALHEETYREIQKLQIYKADVVLVLNTSQEAVDFLAEEIMWAEDLQKKIIYEYTEEVKDNEN